MNWWAHSLFGPTCWSLTSCFTVAELSLADVKWPAWVYISKNHGHCESRLIGSSSFMRFSNPCKRQAALIAEKWCKNIALGSFLHRPVQCSRASMKHPSSASTEEGAKIFLKLKIISHIIQMCKSKMPNSSSSSLAKWTWYRILQNIIGAALLWTFRCTC